MSRIAVGIDVGELGGKGLDLVALDEGRAIVATMRHASLEAVRHAVIDELRPTVVCVDSPSQWALSGSRREAEVALRARGINLFTTPDAGAAGPFHAWMSDGFQIYAAIGERYARYGGGPVENTAAEFYPHATAVALTGAIPVYRRKVAARRDLLRANGIDVARLRGPDQIDAALGALTGLIALRGAHCWVGGAGDALLLPVTSLPDRYARAGTPSPQTAPHSYGGSWESQPNYESNWGTKREPWGRDPWAETD